MSLPPSDPPADVDVCICTFRRPSLGATLESVAAQTLDDGARIRVIVADNDETPSAQALAVEAAARLGLRLAYVHAPARNISVARNACLATATAPLTAFLDDDETARPDWLSRLLARQRDTGADVVLGRVQALYPPDGPSWLERADLHSTRAVVRDDGVIDTGYTCNVLFRRDAVGDRRFDPAYGRTGGEDTLFFNALHAAGCRIAYAPDAVVDEPVTPPRMHMRWLMRRAFRSGQTHALMMQAQGRGPVAALASSTAKIAYCLVAAALGAISGAWRRSMVRAALHTGVFLCAAGIRPLKLY